MRVTNLVNFVLGTYKAAQYFAMACASTLVLFGAVSVASIGIGHKISVRDLLDVLLLTIAIVAALTPKAAIFVTVFCYSVRMAVQHFIKTLRTTYAVELANHNYSVSGVSSSKKSTHIHDEWANADRRL